MIARKQLKKLFKKDLIHLFLERGEERERNISVREKHRLVASPMCPDQPGTELTPQACALTRGQTGDLLLCAMTPNELSHTDQGRNNFLFTL